MTLGIICLVSGAVAGYLFGSSQVQGDFENKSDTRARFVRVLEHEGMESAVRRYLDDQL